MTPTKLDGFVLIAVTIFATILGAIPALYYFHYANVVYHNPMTMSAIWITASTFISFVCTLGLGLWGYLFGSDRVEASDETEETENKV